MSQSSHPIDLQTAATLLRQGDVVAMPTETVYGLAGDAFNEKAIKKIFAVKKRPFFDPLIVHVANRNDVNSLVSFVPPVAEVLMQNFWPGPLTLVLPKSHALSDLVTSGLQTVGVRMPRHPLALQLIDAVGSPLAAPSANLFGRTSPTTAAHVLTEFNGQVAVIDGGPCDIGLESTVVGFESRDDGGHDIVIYRPGAITLAMLKAAIEKKMTATVRTKESPVAPGHLQHHYMPSIPLVIVAAHVEPSVYKDSICQKLKLTQWQPTILKLSDDSNLAARQLYAALREHAESGANVILFEKTDRNTNEQWTAIWNRLEKAAILNLTS